jgi:enoyl-CoA hydratase
MLMEVDAAYEQAMADASIKCVILAARGKHFSSGHDLKEIAAGHLDGLANANSGWYSDDFEGVEGNYAREKSLYEGLCVRWRDLPKPTIAAVQGKALAGALMLIWPCDFVVASEDASFQDLTQSFGIPGVEYFAYTWELGIRKAKEFLMLGEALSAEEAKDCGMVNRVVPRDQLENEALGMARKLAAMPAFGLKLSKSAINATFSAQGFENVQRNAFNAHQLAHAHSRFKEDGNIITKSFMDKFKK